MITKCNLFLLLLLCRTGQFFGATALAEQFNKVGYVEFCDNNNGACIYDFLYGYFDELITFLQANPKWLQAFYSAKERFIRSKHRNYYSTDFFGFYDESKNKERSQISFYYSVHFHMFIIAWYPEFNTCFQISNFLNACFQIQKSYDDIFNQAASDLGFKNIFFSDYSNVPILLKVIKYLPSYVPSKPHYDGSVFSLFLDSTDNESLLCAPYRSSLTRGDFSAPARTFVRSNDQNSIVLIPGTLLTEFGIYPTPHVVVSSGNIRYATVAFAMRPYFKNSYYDFFPLPDFNA